MRLHLPKALQGWRAFLGEIAIIVIGVLIALGAQSLVEDWRWRGEVALANEAIGDELGSASIVAYERLIIQPCLRRHIRDLSRNLADGEGLWKPSPMTAASQKYFNVMPVAYRAPGRVVPTDAWKNAIANGTLSHLPPARVQYLSSLYDQVSDFDELHGEEARAAAKITPLAYNRFLNSGDRTAMLASLAEVDRLNAVITIHAKEIIESVQALHLDFPKNEVEAARRDTVKSQRAVRGACVADLPLSL